MPHQCIYCIKCINFFHSVLPFIISASPVHLSMHHQCINQCIHNASSAECNPSMHRQCIFNASIIHHRCFINALSMHSLTPHQCIVSAVVNASSMHRQCIYQYTINASLHQLHQFRSFSCFFHLLNSFKL